MWGSGTSQGGVPSDWTMKHHFTVWLSLGLCTHPLSHARHTDRGHDKDNKPCTLSTSQESLHVWNKNSRLQLTEGSGERLNYWHGKTWKKGAVLLLRCRGMQFFKNSPYSRLSVHICPSIQHLTHKWVTGQRFSLQNLVKPVTQHDLPIHVPSHRPQKQ